MHTISIIIVNYFTSKNILTLLDSLHTISDAINVHEIIIVNNSPTDKLINNIRFRNLRLISNNENVGFGKACNIGAAASTGNYICFVNPDIIFKENPFSKIIEYIQQNENIGVIGGILLNSDNSKQFSFNSFPDFEWELNELTGKTAAFINKKMNTISSKPFPVDWVIGAFMFMKKNVFMEVGGFDEDFFLYYEDTDLQKRINNAGYKNYLVPDAKVMHGTKSSIKGEEGNKAYNVYMNKSKMLYFYKHSNFLVRNFVRVINLIRILSRLVLFPLKALMQKSSLSDLKILINNFTVYLHSKAYYYN